MSASVVADPPAPAGAPPPPEQEIRALGRSLDAAFPSAARRPVHAAERALAAPLSDRPELRAALFRLVDVAPACRTPTELGEHLDAFLAELPAHERAAGLALHLTGGRGGHALSGRAAAVAVARMARFFIAGEDPAAALPALARLWSGGVASSLDLLGEATVTAAEADRYAARCDDALVQLAQAVRAWPARPLLERDFAGRLPRANLSVKVTALTPLIREAAPEIGREDAARRLRPLLRRARELGAHLHVDMESIASRELIVGLVLGLLAEDEFRDGPDAGIVLQAYLTDSDELLREVLEWAARTERATPLTVRLVKGAYWDHELVEARQRGWTPPVHATKADTDRSFERLTRALLAARPAVRVAIASHNLRSIAHAIVCNRRSGRPDTDLELQVLRGLGDDLHHALAAHRLRVRSYCPVGDLVSGMAYLVRRLLENTANDSFLAARADGADLDRLLRAP
ncbi:MAG: proline dehydrogenase family protein [Actinobacteria bacterium]|nr:proline dehydrogenase family protein [Actinomycetota bacterium]